MDELSKIKEQIIAVVLQHEDQLVEVQNKIDTIVKNNVKRLEDETKILQDKYSADPNSTAGAFMDEYRALEKDVILDTQKQLDALLIEINQKALA